MDSKERVGCWKNRPPNYVDIIVFEVMQQFGVDLGWFYLTFLKESW
jgi:hypothetical protein